MPLALHAVATLLPRQKSHSNLLGTVLPAAYRHLYDPAGRRSRPPTVRRGSTMLYSAPYRAPSAEDDTRTTDLACDAVGRMLAAAPQAAERVQAVLHAQCTLDQQILGSTCLRIEHAHFRKAHAATTIGQLGTAGLPTVLRLAALALQETAGDALVCVSASDKWVAPFFRRVPGLVTYGDAAGACLVGAGGQVARPVAVIEAVQTSCRPLRHDLWTAPAEQQREAMLAHAAHTIACLLDSAAPQDRDALLLAGDGYGDDFSRRLAEATGIGGARLTGPCPECHLSSAAPLFALHEAIEAAVRAGRWLSAVVWTASPAGHAGALLVRCAPDARAIPGGWMSADAHPAPLACTVARPSRSLGNAS